MKFFLKISFFRYIFFTTFGFLNSFFMKFSKEIPDSKLIVLGRGESLNYFKKNHKLFENIKHILLINFSKNDFVDFDSQLLENKIVHVCVNITEDIIPINLLYKLTFGKIFIARYRKFKPSKVNPNRKNYKANIYSNKVKYFPQLMKKHWWLNNSGLFSIAYALEILKIKNLYLFGFDFYQGNFHNSNLQEGFLTKKDAEDHKAAGVILKKNFSNLIDQFPQNIFYLPDTENFRVYNQQNVKKI